MKLTIEQKIILINEMEKSKNGIYIEKERRVELAKEFSINIREITSWLFRQKRIRNKSANKDQFIQNKLTKISKFTSNQISALEIRFKENNYIRNDNDLKTFSKNINMDSKIVLFWFRNKRLCLSKKIKREIEEKKLENPYIEELVTSTNKFIKNKIIFLKQKTQITDSEIFSYIHKRKIKLQKIAKKNNLQNGFKDREINNLNNFDFLDNVFDSYFKDSLIDFNILSFENQKFNFLDVPNCDCLDFKNN